jgi:5-methylcytosine-specific restriction protein A
MCMIEGRVTTANQVDHIKPKAKGGTDDETNLQSLCEAHHTQKTIEETGKTYREKQKIGLDGFPI